jgi:predicted dehydrogenase
MGKMRLGILGTSKHCATRVAPALAGSDLIEVYAVASRDGDRAKEYARKIGAEVAHDSYEALLADRKVDFVYIPLPNHLHLEYITKAADAGKPIICEKPLCRTAKEAVEAASHCAKKGVPLMEAFMYRFHPQWVRAKQLLTLGEIGDVQAVMSTFTYDNQKPSDIRNRVDAAGGALMDIGCYAISSARFAMGREPVRAIATLLRDSAFKTDIRLTAMLDFDGGRTASFTIGTQIPNDQRFIVIGKGGSLSIEVPFNMHADVPGRIDVFTKLGPRVIKTAIADQYKLEFEAFAHAVEKRLPVPTPVSDGIANMAVIDALFASAESGKWETVARY